MESDILLEKVSRLPDNLKSKVSDFIDFLLSKISIEKEMKNKPVFGSGKEMFTIKPGFDKPLDDLKYYM